MERYKERDREKVESRMGVWRTGNETDKQRLFSRGW